MRFSPGAVCFAIAFASAALVAPLGAPSGCGVQDVLIAQPGPGAEAEYDAPNEGGRNASYDGGGNAPCDGGGISPFCFEAYDGAGMAPVEGGVGWPCSPNKDDCSEPFFCATPSCQTTDGECQVRPQCIDPSETTGPPVCGCDGVQYWNDCLRRRDGIASATPGDCTTEFVTCGGVRHTPCPVYNAYCFIEACGETVGACWVLPGTCPEDAGAPNYQGCGDASGDCVDLCTAIRSNAPHVLAGPQCP